MALTLALFQAVINFCASVFSTCVSMMDDVVLIDSPHMSFLDLFCVLFIIDCTYEFLQELRGPHWRYS